MYCIKFFIAVGSENLNTEFVFSVMKTLLELMLIFPLRERGTTVLLGVIGGTGMGFGGAIGEHTDG